MSKTFATLISAAALAGISATSAIASDVSYFQNGDRLAPATVLELGTVRAAGSGNVEIYDYRGGEMGALLGSTPVTAGANANVRVNVGIEPRFDVLAVIRVDGEIVASKDYDIRGK